MSIETLGDAWKLGWRVRARCLVIGPAPKSRHPRFAAYCDTTTELDLKTLVWTRGERFPLDQLADRLRCPSATSCRVSAEISHGLTSGNRKGRLLAADVDDFLSREDSELV